MGSRTPLTVAAMRVAAILPGIALATSLYSSIDAEGKVPALDAPVYVVRASHANPCGEPLVNDAVTDPDLEQVGLGSPGYVPGLEKGKRYDFKLEVFRNKGDDRRPWTASVT